ncbi:nucleoside triphosphate pyrophosphohydrolase [Cyanobacterium aponinum UTEX 3222]|uniref:nucleoside triphosphate pyrophosphohydrolase n=1 Tax=Cyanobacterium aponinum TaxID=379064 RepID=UPI002B4BEF99|nr:nucleoside triphosphate pyrophosphohydrolase [Cyanobacterium aponinum]WRL40171.1 nucleoside triphosphate pyrophosphohydrolase [Cyanobacterium aponinum UTEX 3221]WRL43065.1 nucleoside triphosphate pyrophosphohydrolase [Cyanobacterium aponinum UTEX 3222]
MSKYSKLIRDNIPDLLDKNNLSYQVKILNHDQYKQGLKWKLIEEAGEVFATDNKEDLIEEIADVYEVIEAILEANNITSDDVNLVKEKKAKLKGKFRKKLQLLNLINSEEKKDLNLSIKELETIDKAEVFLQKKVLPQANILDKDSQLLKTHFYDFNRIDSSFLRLKIDTKWQGLAMSNLDFYSWQIMIAKYSGAFAFLQTQHQSAIAFLNSSDNEILKEKYLTQIGKENYFYGVGFSHLRRKEKPLVSATVTEKGYELNGFIPWITGYDIFSHFIIGATLPDGQELYGIIPFQNQNSYLELSQPLQLCAMTSTNTVTGKLNNYLLRKEDIVTIKPRNNIHLKDQENILHHGFFPLGCTFASLRIIEENLVKLDYQEIKETYFELKNQVENLQEKMLTAMVDKNVSFAEKLKLRVEAINLAHKSAIASIITSKGTANIDSHPANRVYREALVYSVSGQTLPLLKDSCYSLIKDN